MQEIIATHYQTFLSFSLINRVCIAYYIITYILSLFIINYKVYRDRKDIGDYRVIHSFSPFIAIFMPVVIIVGIAGAFYMGLCWLVEAIFEFDYSDLKTLFKRKKND